jgi:CubicO group peptidase (beta-lactamase class C family)
MTPGTTSKASEQHRGAMSALDVGALTGRINGALNRWPTVGLAVGLVRDGRVEFFHAQGLADIRSGRPIGDDTVFRIASITKTFTAVAVMQLWERGLVDLDVPVGQYLRAFRVLAPPGVPQPTVRQLLTHTGGMPEVASPWRALRPDFGESFPIERPLPTLSEFYGGGLRLEARPGSRFVYGNHGPATLGQLVEDVTEMPFSRYIRKQIFVPLGMADSDLERTEAVRSRLATGYKVGSHGPRAVREREMVTAGAASIYSTPRDMARYVAALLGGGANEYGRALDPATVDMMFAPHYRPDPRLPGMGLGFFRADVGGHQAVEHQGVHPGFDSQIYLLPEERVGVMAFSNGTTNGSLWLPTLCAGLLATSIGATVAAVRTDVPQHPEIWDEVCGWYRLDAARSDVRLRAMLGAGIEIVVREGRLTLRFLTPIPQLYRGLSLHPDDPADPYSFRIDMSAFGMGSSKVVFSRNADGRSRLHLDLMPLSLDRQSAASNPRWLLAGALGTAGLLGALSIARRRTKLGTPSHPTARPR